MAPKIATTTRVLRSRTPAAATAPEPAAKPKAIKPKATKSKVTKPKATAKVAKPKVTKAKVTKPKAMKATQPKDLKAVSNGVTFKFPGRSAGPEKSLGWQDFSLIFPDGDGPLSPLFSGFFDDEEKHSMYPHLPIPEDTLDVFNLRTWTHSSGSGTVPATVFVSQNIKPHTKDWKEYTFGKNDVGLEGWVVSIPKGCNIEWVKELFRCQEVGGTLHLANAEDEKFTFWAENKKKRVFRYRTAAGYHRERCGEGQGSSGPVTKDRPLKHRGLGAEPYPHGIMGSGGLELFDGGKGASVTSRPKLDTTGWGTYPVNTKAHGNWELKVPPGVDVEEAKKYFTASRSGNKYIPKGTIQYVANEEGRDDDEYIWVFFNPYEHGKPFGKAK